MKEACDRYLKHLRIAIVDDSRAFGAGLRQIVQDYVSHVDLYQDGRLALSEFQKTPPDIIITDLEMPEYNGFAFVTAIREEARYQDIPILVLTGQEDAVTMARIIAQGADSFVAKSQLRETLIVHLLALARLRDLYRKATQGKQLEAVKALIGTYKHDFGNAIAAMEGKVRRIVRENPDLEQNESILSIQKWMGKMIETLQKLDQLRSYEEKQYVASSQILNTG